MDSQKKYRPLDEVYLAESFAKHVPLPPRSKIILHETGTVLVQKDPPQGEVEEYNVGDEKLKKDTFRLVPNIKKVEVSIKSIEKIE
jgi:hypothetical protein